MSDQNINPLFDPKTDNLPIDQKVQQEIINDPKADPQGLKPEDESFLMDLKEKLSTGKINLLSPSTLLNHEIYDKLDEIKQGKVDFNAVNILSDIRQLKGLIDIGKEGTFQVNNLINHIRLSKERVETEYGNVYII